jgi:nickel-dependent lactate racemase
MNESASAGPTLRTAAWYGDAPLALEFPPEWEVTVHWPRTPPPLSDGAIRQAIARPNGQPPLREQCRGKSRPLVIVDDLTRPTPAARVLPFVLEEFRAAGIAASQVTILMATGTHGTPQPDAFAKKVGAEAAQACRLVVHECTDPAVVLGTTSFGTHVEVNKHVAACDFLLGIGGVFPSTNTGFSGGTKLALGVLSYQAIARLHKSHADTPWGTSGKDSSFRKELNEIAGLIGLRTMISVHADPDREPVRVACGDPLVFQQQEFDFAREMFAAPAPGDADVVIADTYPGDVSLRMASTKGFRPFRLAKRGATRIAIAACAEGRGVHRLFPLGDEPKKESPAHRLQRISGMSPSEFARKLAAKLAPRRRDAAAAPPENFVWIYRTRPPREECPARVENMVLVESWEAILHAVRTEQQARERLRVVVYPCAPLQPFE